MLLSLCCYTDIGLQRLKAFFFFFSCEAHCSSSVWLMGGVVIVYPVDAGGMVEIVSGKIMSSHLCF